MKPTNTQRWTRPGNCRGVYAVEMAVTLPFVILMVLAIAILGRGIWQYILIKNASHSAARYVAQGTWQEVKAGTRAAAAKAMIEQTLAQSGISAEPSILVLCPPSNFCSGAVPPPAVSVSVQIVDTAPNFLFPDGMTVKTTATIGYSN